MRKFRGEIVSTFAIVSLIVLSLASIASVSYVRQNKQTYKSLAKEATLPEDSPTPTKKVTSPPSSCKNECGPAKCNSGCDAGEYCQLSSGCYKCLWGTNNCATAPTSTPKPGGSGGGGQGGGSTTGTTSGLVKCSGGFYRTSSAASGQCGTNNYRECSRYGVGGYYECKSTPNTTPGPGDNSCPKGNYSSYYYQSECQKDCKVGCSMCYSGGSPRWVCKSVPGLPNISTQPQTSKTPSGQPSEKPKQCNSNGVWWDANTSVCIGEYQYYCAVYGTELKASKIGTCPTATPIPTIAPKRCSVNNVVWNAGSYQCIANHYYYCQLNSGIYTDAIDKGACPSEEPEKCECINKQWSGSGCRNLGKEGLCNVTPEPKTSPEPEDTVPPQQDLGVDGDTDITPEPATQTTCPSGAECRGNQTLSIDFGWDLMQGSSCTTSDGKSGSCYVPQNSTLVEKKCSGYTSGVVCLHNPITGYVSTDQECYKDFGTFGGGWAYGQCYKKVAAFIYPQTIVQQTLSQPVVTQDGKILDCDKLICTVQP